MTMTLKNKILDQIRLLCKKDKLEEICGFIIKNNDNYEFINAVNKHPDKQNYFLICPKEYLNIKNNFEIIYLFHSHPNGGSFSETDMLYQKYHNLNMLIYNVKDDCFEEMMCK